MLIELEDAAANEAIRLAALKRKGKKGAKKKAGNKKSGGKSDSEVSDSNDEDGRKSPTALGRDLSPTGSPERLALGSPKKPPPKK